MTIADWNVPLRQTQQSSRVNPAIVNVPGAATLSGRGLPRCEQVRCVSQERLLRRVGTLPSGVMGDIEDWLRVFLGL